MFCKKEKAESWEARLSEELSVSNNAWFLTLTYDDENIPIYERHADGDSCFMPVALKRDIQLFNKRLRKKCDSEIKKSHLEFKKIRYYVVSEYGPTTDRPHYHGIYYNIPIQLIDSINDIWKKGFVKVDPVNQARIRYVTNYILDKDKWYGSENEEMKPFSPFALMSTKPALGSGYIEQMKKRHIENRFDFYQSRTGHKRKLPRYYRDRIFTEHEKKTLSNEKKEKAIEQQTKKDEENMKKGIKPLIYESEQIINYQKNLIKRKNKRKL